MSLKQLTFHTFHTNATMNNRLKPGDDCWDTADIDRIMLSNPASSSPRTATLSSDLMSSRSAPSSTARSNGNLVDFLRLRGSRAGMAHHQPTDVTKLDQLDIDQDSCVDTESIPGGGTLHANHSSCMESPLPLASMTWLFDSSDSSLPFASLPSSPLRTPRTSQPLGSTKVVGAPEVAAPYTSHSELTEARGSASATATALPSALSTSWNPAMVDMEPVPIDPYRMVVVPRIDHTTVSFPATFARKQAPSTSTFPLPAAASASASLPATTTTAKVSTTHALPHKSASVGAVAVAGKPASFSSLNSQKSKRSRSATRPPATTEPTTGYTRPLMLVPSSDENLKRHKRFKKENKTALPQADRRRSSCAGNQDRSIGRSNSATSVSTNAKTSDSHSNSTPHAAGASLAAGILSSTQSHTSLSSAQSTPSMHTANQSFQPGNDATTPNSNQIRQHQETQWEARFNELCIFKRQFGHCAVPYTYKVHPQLAQWTKRQRYQFKLKTEGRHCTLTDRRQQILDDVGFVWDSHHALWESRFQELAAYREEHGHCLVPCKDSIHKRLAVWIKCQRRQYRLLQQNRPSNITQQRIDRLNDIGFCWSPRKG